MAQVGRISGPLLNANLERNGIDLAFRNTQDDTQLLFLDVNTGLIGVNKSDPGNTADISGTTKTINLIASTSANIADFSIDTNNINNLTGDINLNASEIISLSNFQTDNISITDNTISTYRSNSNLDLQTNGTGILDVHNNVNIDGSLHATGNITFDGSIILGDALAQDTVIINSDVNSSIIPDQNNTYSLGTPSKRWKDLYSVFLNGQSITTASVAVGPVFLSSRQGNIIYVAENGNDSNVGDHPNGPFKTLKRALDFADASTSGPVTIYVYAGGYEEELPLVVPTNVNIIGEDYRNTFIRPTSADQSKDIFHLNGESTVQNLTITDFYYDSGNDTGYAFRFAPNTVVTTRSPYIQNVTVITKGTTTSASDPRGFASGDAGKGALVDGADVLSASEEASMLFHSVTFITPGVDGLTMTNGVRVEWLNSFTYFANRGLYAVNGVTGHLSTDGSTVKYGAEIRSIGSANVYGNYGAVADGSDCLMYLIQHNMAYIGVGKFVDNDPSRVIQSQEVSELNSGRIYFQTEDHLGNFRVGNNFLVDQESGETSLVLTEADIDSLGGMTVTTNGSTTFIDGTRVETGNIRFRENTIRSLSGNIEIDSAAGNINFTSSTNILKDLDITGNLSFDGTLNTIGDQSTDTVDFNVDFDQDLVPNQTLQFDLGSPTKVWNIVHGSQANLGDVQLFDNVITTNNSNADLEFRATGTGRIYFENENLNITNNLQVQTTTFINNLSTNDLTTAGAIALNNNFSTTNLTITQNLNVAQIAQFEEIKIDDNYITTTTSNTDFELRASGTGNILVPTEDLVLTNNFDTQGTVYSSDWISATQVEAVNFDNSTVRTQTNIIETHISNADLDIRATGNVLFSNDVNITQNLTTSNNISGENLTSDSITVGAINITDSFAMEDMTSSTDIQIFDNVITTTNSNSNLELRGAGAGSIYLEILEFTNNTIGSKTTPDSSLTDIVLDVEDQLIIDSTKALKLPIGPDDTLTQSQIRLNTDKNLFQGYATSNIFFNGVYSDNSLTNLRAHPTNDILLLDIANIQVGNFDSDGINIHGLQVDDILIDGLGISTTVSNSDLELRPDGSGGVIIDNIKVSGSTIQNTATDEPLVFSSTDDGYYQFDGDGAVKIPTGSNSNRPASPILGQTRVNTDSGEMETWIGDQWQTSAGAFEAVSEAEMDDISLIQTLIYG